MENYEALGGWVVGGGGIFRRLGDPNCPVGSDSVVRRSQVGGRPQKSNFVLWREPGRFVVTITMHDFISAASVMRGGRGGGGGGQVDTG